MLKKINFVLLLFIFIVAFLCIQTWFSDYKFEKLGYAIANDQTKSEKNTDFNYGITFNEALMNKKKTIVMFYASFCSTCHQFAPILAYLEKNQDYNLVVIDAQSYEGLQIRRRYNLDFSYVPIFFISDNLNNINSIKLLDIEKFIENIASKKIGDRI